MLREIINIDEDKCDGCGLCVPACHEGALQIIEGKARLISDLFCDGLGACVGDCPQNAISIEMREAEEYDEIKVMEMMIKKSDAVINAHLTHLAEHKEQELLQQAMNFLKENERETNYTFEEANQTQSGCPGSKMMELGYIKKPNDGQPSVTQDSMLNQWPVMLHLVNPMAPSFKNKELVIMATCGPLASANMHQEYLKGRSVVVACPKLDYTEPYAEKLQTIFKLAHIPRAIVVRMEVPCCGGLSQMAFYAANNADTNMILEEHTVSITGDIINKKVLINKR